MKAPQTTQHILDCLVLQTRPVLNLKFDRLEHRRRVLRETVSDLVIRPPIQGQGNTDNVLTHIHQEILDRERWFSAFCHLKSIIILGREKDVGDVSSRILASILFFDAYNAWTNTSFDHARLYHGTSLL